MRRPSRVTVDYVCPECGEAFEVDLTISTSGRTNCRSDNAEPPESAKCDPIECISCGHEIDASILEREWEESV